MYPSLDEVKTIAASGDYRRVPVAEELLADRFTAVEVMRKLRSVSTHVFLLESAEQGGQWGRWSFLGCNPKMEVTCQAGVLRVRTRVGGRLTLTHEEHLDHPGDYIRALLADNRSAEVEGMPPFAGGLLGYFSFEYLNYAEPTLVQEGLEGDFRDVDLMLFDTIIAIDHYRQKLMVISGVSTDNVEMSYADAADDILQTIEVLRSDQRHLFPALFVKGDLEPRLDEARFCSMVEAAKHHIREGDIFQVVLSNPMTAPVEGSLFDAYRILRTTNPSPYMVYLTSDDIEVIAASPETLVRLDHGVLHTFPLAGTRPRGETPDADRALECDLLADEKELAEHNMLVDLGRNDLGRISELGSVRVDDYLSILRFSHVMHIGSHVTGTIASDKDALDALDAILPAGTLSGAPKLRACQIIHELEGQRRGIYGGAIGYLDFSGNLDTCIGIRLAYKKDGRICVQSGAGIVADSVPESEFRECRNKAAAVIGAIRAAEGGVR